MALVCFVLISLVLRITSDTKMCLKTFIILTLNIKVRKLNSNMLNENVSMLVEQHKKTLHIYALVP